MPKANTPKDAREARRHNPLEEDIGSTGILRTKSGKRKSRNEDDREENKFVDSKQSRKILKIGQELTEEAQLESRAHQSNPAFDLASRSRVDVGEEPFEDDGEEWADEEDDVEVVELAPEDRETFSKFFPTQEDPLLEHGWDGPPKDVEQSRPGTDLAALILEKIAQHEALEARRNGDEVKLPEEEFDLHPKVVEVYTKIGLILSRYKSGKLPKPFKILPTVPRWEEILEITQPDQWTPNACYEATKIWVSAKPATAQKFMEIVLLDRVREEIHETKKVNVHLFNALKKGLYKPAAFFKGFLFPLVSSGTCTLREAHIISAALVRVSIPVLHSAAAIKGLCDIAAEESSAGTEGGGATNMLIKALLEKKYALPFQVIDALVFHFLRFRSVDPAGVNLRGSSMTGIKEEKDFKLPVIWHQSLLVFAQRYKNDITEDQREALLDLLLARGHSAIGPEVRRELLAGRGRGEAIEPEGPLDGGDDTMVID